MDLQVGTHIRLQSPIPKKQEVNPHIQADIDIMYGEPIQLPTAIPAHTVALVSTQSNFSIHEKRLGLLTLRHTWAGLGLMAPMTIADPGFKGHLTLMVYNSSNYRIMVRPDDSLWSMTMIPTTSKNYEGRYQNQEPLQIPKAFN